MKCKECEHFHIRQEPLGSLGDYYDLGLAECKKYNLVTDFLNHGKFNRLYCVENDSKEKSMRRIYSDEIAKEYSEMVYMYLKGYTLQEIADKYGITKQAVDERFKTLTGARRKFINKGINRCIYPNLKEWLNDNEYNIKNLKEELNYKSYKPLVDRLTGKTEWILSDIVKLVELTGKPMDYLFEKETTEESADV